VVFVVSTLVGLMMWGAGVWWLVHGVTSVATRFLVGGLKFNMGFWGFIFPLGVFTTARALPPLGCRRLLTHAEGSPGGERPQQQQRTHESPRGLALALSAAPHQDRIRLGIRRARHVACMRAAPQATIRLASSLPSRALAVLSMVFTAALVLLWLAVAGGTARGVATGQLLQAPCLTRRPSLDLLADAGPLEESSVSRRATPCALDRA